MQGLENLTRGELLQLVRTLEQRLEQVENGIAAARRAPIELDFVCAQALQVLDNSGVPAFVYDTAGGFRLLAANQCMAGLSGYSRDELLGLGLMSLLAHDEREGVRRLLELPRQGGFSSSGGWRHRTKLGEIREVEASGYDLVFKSRHARFVIVQDVTRRKREALVQQRLASIVEHSSDCIISTTVDGTVLSWNRAAERLFGYTAAEIVGRSVEVLWPPEIAEHERARLRPRVLAGELFDCKEAVRLSKSGERIEASVSVAPLRDASGTIVGLSSIVRDIRQQKDAERQLAQSHERLRALANLSYDWCWEQDENLRFTFHSGQWGRPCQQVHTEVPGSTHLELPLQWFSQQQREHYARMLAERKPFRNVEYPVRDCDGREFRVLVSGEPIFDETGAFRGYRGIGRDITEAKAKEAQLELLSTIVGSTDDAVMSWSLDGILLSWNAGAQAMLGFAPVEVLGRSLSLLLPPGNDDWQELSRRITRGEKVLNQETVRKHRNGTMIQVAVTCSPMRDESGRVTAICCIARDIRRHKQQGRLVVEGHQRLKLALESAGLSLWDWDIPGSQVHYDDAFARLLGYGPGELPLAGRLWEGLVHPEDAPLVSERIECHLRELCDFCELELRVGGRSGDWIWIGARGRVVARDRSGEPLRMMGTSQDISVRKRAEHTGQMLSAFLESSEDSIISRALDGTILSWNHGAERILGYSAPEVVGRNILAIYPEERTAEMGWLNDRVRTGQTVSHLETTRRHKDGRALQLDLTVAPMRDADGRVIGAASIGRDITERSRAEAARSLLAAVAESSQDAIYSYALDGRILSWNRGAEDIFGYSAREAIGQELGILAPQGLEREGERLTRVLRGERVAPFELAARHKSGDPVLVSVSAAPLRDDAGRIVGVAAVAREIGTQKRLELLTARTQAIGHVGGWELDCRSGRLFWTDEMYRIQDLSPEQFSPSVESATAMYPPDAIAVVREAIHCAVELGEHFDLELPLITARGRQRWVRIIGEAQREDGRVTHVYGAMQDITARRQTEDALRDSERQLETILDNAAEGMVVLSPSGAIERFNREAQQIFGYGPNETHALSLKQLILELGFENALDQDVALMQRLIGSHRELTGRRKDGSLFPLELAVSEIAIGPGTAKFTAIVRDITERKSWESRIYNLAYSDSLTGLPNRLLLRDRLEHAIAAAQRNRTLVGVLFLDLDHFKAINDSFGHHVGDALLREIGERAKSCVREIDTVSRLGGDEFVVVLPELREGLDAGAVARKILAALSQPYWIDTLEIAITPTLGISLYPQDGPDADALLRCADTAMYHAKESGKNRFEYFGPRGG